MTYAGRCLNRCNRVFPEKKTCPCGEEAKFVKQGGKNPLFRVSIRTNTWTNKSVTLTFIYVGQPPIVGWPV